MTKFEEEVNKYNIFERTVYLEGGPKKILIDHFKNWHSDEEFQAEKDARKKEYEIHQDIYSKTSKKLNEAELEIANLKSQLQQQALPVVPEFIAEWIEYVKEDGIFNALALFDKDDTPEDVNEWLFLQSNDDNINLILRAWLDGYTVEKPQLFYLKNKLTTSYLILDTSTGYFEHWGSNEATGRYKSSFTQQEIDSMETGSYELVPVEDGE
ncbi:DUF1642 domain-containing protein [Lactococcus lactis]|uniref:DUF1642 domain-containing protein n=1 Tax=Lactococcus lactis TaxID=1358 RepID=UPI00223AB8D0|nr:DUF1642 domain-containing protein [Lactococcus lactis]MCT0442612.1 DUF1642 domain-containing protein [Lactococcus lactis subsp. lactis]